MDLFLKITIGIFLFVVTSVIAYLFKIRQLYSTSLHLYSKSVLADSGSISEIQIYNNGNNVEEDIKLELNPRLKCSMLASNISDLEITENNTILLDRLHPKTKASILLLIDEGEFSPADMISLSSKECVGKVFSNTLSIPSNYGSTAIFITFIFLGLPALVYFGPSAIGKIYNTYVESRYSEVFNKGWKDIDSYLISDFSDSYSKQEFPLRILDQTIDGRSLHISFEVLNKSAIPLQVTFEDGIERDVKEIDYGITDFIKIVDVEPMSNKKVTFKIEYQKNMLMKFAFTSGSEYIYDIKYNFDLNKTK